MPSPQPPTPRPDTERRPITDEDIDRAARAVIPQLEKAFERATAIDDPDPIPGCYLDGKKATWIGWALYFATEGDTVPAELRLPLCSPHAEKAHRDHVARRLEIGGRPVFKFTLQEVPK